MYVRCHGQVNCKQKVLYIGYVLELLMFIFLPLICEIKLCEKFGDVERSDAVGCICLIYL